MTLFPDKTFLIAWALFLLLLVLLSRFLFKPMAAYLERRRREMEAVKAEAERLRDEAQETFIRYNYQLSEAKREIIEEKGRARRAMEDEVKSAMMEARRQANVLLGETTAKIDLEMQRIRQEMAAETEVLAKDLARKLASPGGKA
jgi:F-type H+-transporting ATPase subunit b